MAEQELPQPQEVGVNKEQKGVTPRADLRSRLLLTTRVFLSHPDLSAELASSNNPIYPRAVTTLSDAVDDLGDTTSLNYYARQKKVSYDVDETTREARAEIMVTYLNSVLPTAEQLRQASSEPEAARNLMTTPNTIRGYRHASLLLNTDVDNLLMTLPQEQFDEFTGAVERGQAEAFFTDEEMRRLRNPDALMPENSTLGYFLSLYEHPASQPQISIAASYWLPEPNKMPIQEALQKVNEQFLPQPKQPPTTQQ